MNIFYSPELEAPPMAPECFITFSFIQAQSEGETTRVVFQPGLNQNISEEDWEKILEKPVAQNMLAQGSLRVVKETELPEVLKDEDLPSDTPRALDLSKLSVADANAAINKLHDIPALLKLQETEKRVPVRTAITRRINTLGS